MLLNDGMIHGSVLSASANKQTIPLKIRYKVWTINVRESRQRPKKYFERPSEGLVELLPLLKKKLQASLAPWKQNIKK